MSLLVCGLLRASAASPITNCVSEAEADLTYGANPGTHALYLPGIGTDFVFTATSGKFVQFPDGTALLTGTVFSQANAQKGFAIDVHLSGYRTSPPSGSPKKQLSSDTYDGPVDTDTWIYYTDFTGTLTGLSNYAGATLSIARTGPAFQVGFGANGKNINFGASSWFTWTVTHQPNSAPDVSRGGAAGPGETPGALPDSGGALPSSGQGDFNVDLFTCLDGGEQCATNSFPDPRYSDSDRTHAIYMPGIATDFIFTPAARFVQSNDGTATLTGLAVSRANVSRAFQVNVLLSGYTTNTPPGSPKEQLKPEAYVENGGPVNPATWSYYPTFKGTFIGVGNYAGAVLTIERAGPAFQIGVGANGKNLNYGASSWFTWKVTRQPNSGSSLTSSGQGDFDLDLGTCNGLIVEPPHNQTNCVGGTAMFSVTATGTSLTYQWTFGEAILLGATNSTLLLSNLSLSNAGPYCVIVSSPGSAVTNCAFLVVNQNTIVTVPPTNQTACVGGAALFQVTALGGALAYQWYFGNTILSNQRNSTLVLSNVTATQAGTYSVVVSGTCGPAVTNSAVLTVNQNVAIAVPPAGRTNVVGGSVTFSVGATGSGLTYQWIFNSAIVGTNSTLTLNNLTTNQAGLYCVVVSGTCGKPVTNCTILVIENRPPIASNDSYATPFNTPLTVNAPGVLLNDSDPDGDALTAIRASNPAHGNLSFQTNGAFVYTPTNGFVGLDTFTYRASDGRLTSSVATVSITVQTSTVVIVEPPHNQTNCVGGTATFSVSATGTGLTYQWTFGGTTLVGVTNSTLVIGNVAVTNAGSYCVIVRDPTSAVTNCALLVVNENTIVTVPPTPQTVCVSNTALFRVTAIGTALAYQWYFGTTRLSNQTNSALVLSNVTVTQAGTYSVVISGACGPTVTNSTTLTVNQNVAVTRPPASQTNVAGSNVIFTVIATGSGLTYQWFFNGAIVSTNSTLILNHITTNQAGPYCVIVSGTCGRPVTNCTILTVLVPPTVTIVSPTNGAIFIAPAHFSVIADANDADGVVTNVQIFSGTNLIGTFTNAPYLVPRTNLPSGIYTYYATATDNDGLRATSAPVTVTVTSGPPIYILGPIVLNRQNGLFEQFARIFNPTPEDFPNGLRVFVHLATNDTTNIVWNATGTNASGVPFIDVHTPLPSGGQVDVLIQYYVPNARSVPMVTLTAEPLPFPTPPVPRPKVTGVTQTSSAVTIQFTTARNCLYYLQCSDDLVHWSTLPGIMRGTGDRMECTDSSRVPRRFYRAIALR